MVSVELCISKHINLPYSAYTCVKTKINLNGNTDWYVIVWYVI